jgi:hypothetical protein
VRSVVQLYPGPYNNHNDLARRGQCQAGFSCTIHITVTVPRKPADAGIDPYQLLIDLERFDDVEEVKIGELRAPNARISLTDQCSAVSRRQPQRFGR